MWSLDWHWRIQFQDGSKWQESASSRQELTIGTSLQGYFSVHMTLSLASPRYSDLRENKTRTQTPSMDLASEVINLQLPRKLKIELPYDSAIPLLGMYSDKTIIQKDTCTLMFIAALFTIAKTWKQPKCPLTEGQIKKRWYIYTMEHYSAIKNMTWPLKRIK